MVVVVVVAVAVVVAVVVGVALEELPLALALIRELDGCDGEAPPAYQSLADAVVLAVLVLDVDRDAINVASEAAVDRGGRESSMPVPCTCVPSRGSRNAVTVGSGDNVAVASPGGPVLALGDDFGVGALPVVASIAAFGVAVPPVVLAGSSGRREPAGEAAAVERLRGRVWRVGLACLVCVAVVAAGLSGAELRVPGAGVVLPRAPGPPRVVAIDAAVGPGAGAAVLRPGPPAVCVRGGGGGVG